MKVYENSFIHGRELAKKIVIGVVISAVATLLSGSMASLTVQMALLALTTVLMVVLIYVVATQCRCPYCGKTIVFGVLAVTHCPRCKRSLTTGKKTKKR